MNVTIDLHGTKKEIDVCCKDMEKAFDSCTDNEAYGALAHLRDGFIHIGSYELDDISFCPWCGTKINCSED